EAQKLLSQGRSQQALDVLHNIPVSSVDPQPWLDRADAHLALGQIPQAIYALRVADELGASDPAYASHAALTRAALQLARNKPAEAIMALEQVARPKIEGRAYSYFVFRRVALPGLLLPRLDLLQRTGDDLAVYRQLAQLYSAQGRAGDATWASRQA